MRLDELLAPDSLRRMIDRRTVGDAWPYANGARTEIESHLQATVAALSAIPGLGVIRDHDHYGCGYASYAVCFVWRSDGHGVRRAGRNVDIDGLGVWISRLAPLACLGPVNRWDWYADEARIR